MLGVFDEWFDVTDVEVIGPYTLRVSFDDGSVQVIDLEQVLYGEIFDSLRDPARFAEVTVNQTTGTIEWPTGANFNPVVLHDWPEHRDRIIEESKQFMPGATLSEALLRELAALEAPDDPYVWHYVLGAKYMGDYRILLTFDDGFEREIDFEPVLIAGIFGELRDKGIFKQFYVNHDAGTVEWANGADFSPNTLYDWPDYVQGIVQHMSKVQRERRARELKNQSLAIPAD